MFQSGDCYEDNELRILSFYVGRYANNQGSSCIAACIGYAYAGVEYGTECYCGNALPNSNLHRPGECTITCPGNTNETCGGHWRMNIFDVPRKLTRLVHFNYLMGTVEMEILQIV